MADRQKSLRVMPCSSDILPAISFKSESRHTEIFAIWKPLVSATGDHFNILQDALQAVHIKYFRLTSFAEMFRLLSLIERFQGAFKWTTNKYW